MKIRIFTSKKPLIILFVTLILLAPVYALQNLMALQGSANKEGLPINNGNLTITIWNQSIGGVLVYNSSQDYAGVINNGRFDIMLGDGGQQLQLEYGKFYYMDMSINDQDLNFSGLDRQIFESSTGIINKNFISINETWAESEIPSLTVLWSGTVDSSRIVFQNLMNVNSSVYAQYLDGISIDAILNNDTILNNRINLLNTTKANTGNCPFGQFVQNSTSLGVQCSIPDANNPFNQNLNTGNNVQFENITASNLLGNINWSYISNIPNYILMNNLVSLVGNWSSDKSDYNTTKELYSYFYNISNPNGYIAKNQANYTQYCNISNLQELNDSESINYLNTTKLDANDQRYNDTELINAVNTTSTIQGLGFNTTTQLDTKYMPSSALINSSQLNTTNNPSVDQTLTYSGSNDQFTWTDTPKTVYMTADQSSTSTTYAPVNELYYNVQPDTRYRWDCSFVFQTVATATGIGIGVTGTYNPQYLAWYGTVHQSNTALQNNGFNVFTSGTTNGVLGTAVSAAGNSKPAWMYGYILTNESYGGNITIMFRTEVAASQATLQRGSSCVFRRAD